MKYIECIMHLMEKQDLLKVIEEYIISEPTKKWRPGKDHVHYAGPILIRMK